MYVCDLDVLINSTDVLNRFVGENAERKDITKLFCDSRVELTNPETSLFFAIQGNINDGHDHLKTLYDEGVRYFVVSNDVDLYDDCVVIQVEDTRKALSDMADMFFRSPSQKLNVIGVTGTKGKTTTTNLVLHILDNLGSNTGLIGTIAHKLPNGYVNAKNTTPDSLELLEMMALMRDAGMKNVVMEVSSHAIALERIAHIDFDIAALTNITHDHLDFHKTKDSYIQVKAELFANLGRYGRSEGKLWPKYAIINKDDENYETVLKSAAASSSKVLTYSLKSDTNTEFESDYEATNVVLKNTNTLFDLETPSGKFKVKSHLVGTFNVYNMLAAIAIVNALGYDVNDIINVLSTFKGVSGRFQRIERGQDFAVIVDYAHTPDSLKNVLETAKEFTNGKLITVFGCGGDRDKTKRPIMGNVAVSLSDHTIITSDNPRSENPEEIIADIIEGIESDADIKTYTVVSDRREAIKHAINIAKPFDTVIIAGKGHETYQILKDKTIHFDDVEEAMHAIDMYGMVAYENKGQ